MMKVLTKGRRFSADDLVLSMSRLILKHQTPNDEARKDVQSLLSHLRKILTS